MKKKSVVIIASLMLSVAISFFAKSDNLKNTLLDNIEALANNDDGSDPQIAHNFTPTPVEYYVEQEVIKTTTRYYTTGLPYIYQYTAIESVPVPVICCMPSGGINSCNFAGDLENHCDRVNGWWSPFN